MPFGFSRQVKSDMEKTSLNQACAQATDRPNILVVDDEELICSQLASFLERQGYQVDVALDGWEVCKRQKRSPRNIKSQEESRGEKYKGFRYQKEEGCKNIRESN